MQDPGFRLPPTTGRYRIDFDIKREMKMASPVDEFVRVGQLNFQLGLVLTDIARAAWERFVQISEKISIECSTESDAVMQRLFQPNAESQTDVRGGQWDDIVADVEEWRLETMERSRTACEDWRRAWLNGATGESLLPAASTVLCPWPVALTDQADIGQTRSAGDT
ncbi:hypothetical protein [Sphingobium sp. AntQ-1]|uniref:hypothetical protein n=1 Tax=Sphingobium sp. AntQ-1 TaxID=2930091 RepID=UPI00234ED03D|nr:hypothetical protein [Sphingobium sp. AntQ-1]